MRLVVPLAVLAAAFVPTLAAAQSDAEVAAREFLEASQARENFETGFQLGLTETAGDLPPEAMAVIQEVMREHFDYDSLEADFVRMYAEVFTAEELRALAAFYRTPTGRKLADRTPEIAMRTQRLTNARLEQLMPALIQRMMELED